MSYRVNLSIPATQPMQLRVFTIHRIRTLIVMIIVKSCKKTDSKQMSLFKWQCPFFNGLSHLKRDIRFESVFTLDFRSAVHTYIKNKLVRLLEYILAKLATSNPCLLNDIVNTFIHLLM